MSPGNRRRVPVVQLMLLLVAMVGAGVPVSVEGQLPGEVYVAAGWQFSILGESSYINGRPELTLGVVTSWDGSGVELGVSWDHLGGMDYRRFLLDEELGAGDDSTAGYHVLELSPRMRFRLDGNQISLSALLGLHVTAPLGTNREIDNVVSAGDISLYRLSPLRIMGGLRVVFHEVFFADWRLYWMPTDGGFTWSRWDAVHGHGLLAGIDLTALVRALR